MELRLIFGERFAEIVLDDPGTKNALDDAFVAELSDALRDIAKRPDIEAVVLRGAGGVFCSGGSFAELAEMRRIIHEPGGVTAVRTKVRRNSRVVELLRDQPQRTIAVLDGAAVGAGVGLAAACDLRVATRASRVIAGFDRVGLSSDLGTGPLLRALVGLGAATELLVNGETWDADTALARGFVTEVIDAEELDARVSQLIGDLRPGDGSRSRVQRAVLEDPAAFAEALDREARCFAEHLSPSA